MEPHKIAEADGVKSGLNMIQSFHPELVFLDVEMRDGTGFDLLNSMTAVNFQVVFTTAHNQYAVRAFKCSALDYLLKPVDPEELSQALKKAAEKRSVQTMEAQLSVLLQHLRKSDWTETQLVLNDHEMTYFVKVAHVLFCEASGSYTKVHIHQEPNLLLSKSLGKFEELFDEFGFIRVHHAFLVNPRHIKQYDKTNGHLVLDSGHRIPVSSRKKETVMAYLERRRG